MNARFIRRALLFVVPHFGVAILFGPVAVVLGGIYAKYYGLSLAEIALVMLIAKVFDAVSDPCVGYCSDRWHASGRSRRTLIAIGAFLLIPSAYFLYIPAGDPNSLYFGFWYVLLYFSLTLFTIPYLSWINEFTSTTEEKSFVFSAMAFVIQVGGALFFLLPLMPAFGSGVISPKILEYTAIIGSLVILVSLFVTFRTVPIVMVSGGAKRRVMTRVASPGLGSIFRSLRRNKPFFLFTTVYMLLGIAVGMWMGMIFIYVDAYLKLGEYFAEISFWCMVCGVLAVPIWFKLTQFVGKKRGWLFAMVLFALGFATTGLLVPMSDPFALLLTALLVYFSVASAGVIAPSLLCDIIDYGRLVETWDHSGIYFSFYTLLTKVQIAIGGSIGLSLAAAFGFTMGDADIESGSILGLKLAVSIVPVIFSLIAALVIYFFPLNERKSLIVRKRLGRKDLLVGS